MIFHKLMTRLYGVIYNHSPLYATVDYRNINSFLNFTSLQNVTMIPKPNFGKDERFPDYFDNNSEMYEMVKNIEKQKLLMFLEDKHVPMHLKIDTLSLLNEILVSNITSGGLFNDYNFTF